MAQLRNSSDEVAVKVREELHTVAESMSDLYGEMMASYETYSDDLDQQIESLEIRAATADAQAKARLNDLISELQAKREIGPIVALTGRFR